MVMIIKVLMMCSLYYVDAEKVGSAMGYFAALEQAAYRDKL
jgi:hypothetical protein